MVTSVASDVHVWEQSCILPTIRCFGIYMTHIWNKRHNVQFLYARSHIKVSMSKKPKEPKQLANIGYGRPRFEGEEIKLDEILSKKYNWGGNKR